MKSFGTCVWGVCVLALAIGLGGCAGDAASTPDAEGSTPDDGAAAVADEKNHGDQDDASKTAAGEPRQASMAGCDAIELEPPDLGMQAAIPVHVPGLEEREYCMLLQVKEGFELNWSDGRYTVGSHHGQVHATSYKEIPTMTVGGEEFDGDPTEPHRCTTPSALWDEQGVIAYGRSVELAESGAADDTLDTSLPENVAFHIEAGDVLLLNFHMINYTEEPVDACYKVNLVGIPPEQVEHEAGTITFYNPFITVPAGSASTSRMACPVTQDITLLSAVSHMHERGAYSESFLWDGDPTAPDSKRLMMLHSSPDWREPDFVQFADGGLKISEGHWIDWKCDYENMEERNVAQGFRSTDEMCMFIGRYYPKDVSFEDCGTGGFSKGRVLEGAGDMNGAEFLQCIAGVQFTLVGAGDDPNRYATQECFTDVCDAVAPLTMPLLDCFIENGAANCGDLQKEIAAATCD